MNNNTREVLAQALKLPEQDRAKIVEELLGSLDHEELEVDIDKQWASVIKRRSREIEFGTVKSLTWSEVKKMANARARKNA